MLPASFERKAREWTESQLIYACEHREKCREILRKKFRLIFYSDRIRLILLFLR